jgi:hypothetical protein
VDDEDAMRDAVAPQEPEVDPVAALVAVVERLRRERDEDRAVIDQLTTEKGEDRRGSGLPPLYETWTDWVDDWLTPRISRSPHRHRWCRDYIDHPEVADRLEALWYSWETHWPDPLARLGWFRDGLDHHLPAITAEDGPLRSCSALENVHSPSPGMTDPR